MKKIKSSFFKMKRNGRLAMNEVISFFSSSQFVHGRGIATSKYEGVNEGFLYKIFRNW